MVNAHPCESCRLPSLASNGSLGCLSYPGDGLSSQFSSLWISERGIYRPDAENSISNRGKIATRCVGRRFHRELGDIRFAISGDGFRHLIEIGDAFGLRIPVMQEPASPSSVGSCRCRAVMTGKSDGTLLGRANWQRSQFHAREFWFIRGAFGRASRLRPNRSE